MRPPEYRAVAYFHPEGHADQATRLESDGLPTCAAASVLLDQLLARPGFAGGHLEAWVQRQGWVVVDDEEDAIRQAESAAIIRRRTEQDELAS